MFEKKSDAQLARTWRIELPNLWTYQFAIMFVIMLCERLFESKGMCVQFAIHDSENDKGQRNLHAYIMLTLRSIDEQGHWMPKQKKVYLTDENGERIPYGDTCAKMAEVFGITTDELLGVEKNHTFIINNGDVVDIQNGIARQTRKVAADFSFNYFR